MWREEKKRGENGGKKKKRAGKNEEKRASQDIFIEKEFRFMLCEEQHEKSCLLLQKYVY